MTADIINGSLETLGTAFMVLSCFTLWRDKQVRGIAMSQVLFYLAWGYWNLVYYSQLDQAFSFYAGVVAVTVNTTWVSMMIWFRFRPCDRMPGDLAESRPLCVRASLM
jgi:ABC-type transport system involved in cytochrome c biogenesis permease subunit